MKKLPDKMKKVLLQLYNEEWKSIFLPKEWQNYQVLFIDKPGKKKVALYIYTIALSSCVGKIMKRMMNERLIW